MRKLLLILLLVCSSAWADVTQEHFSFAQVFDVQWYTSNGKLYASSFNYLYASVNASGQLQAGRLTSTQTNAYASAGDYLAFFHSSTNPGTFGLGVYDTNNNLVRVLDYTGTFVALADGAIFYNGNGSWGTLFTTAQGYSYGQNGNWTITQSYPSNTYMTNYTPPNTTPLAAGQSAPPAVTITSRVNSTITTTATSGATVYTYSQPITTTTYSDGSQTVVNNGSAVLLSTTTVGGGSGITNAEQTSMNISRNQQVNLPTTSHVYIDQIGSGDHINITVNNQSNLIGGQDQTAMKVRGGNNTVTIHQGDPTNTLSTHNVIAADLLGGSNTLTVNQGTDANGNGSGTDTGYHYSSIYVSGVNNSINVQQQATVNNNVGNYASINVTGNQNNIGLIQTGNSPKQLFTAVSGNQNTETISQTGLGQHFLDVNLNGDGNTATVNQSGNTANTATINLTNAGGPASVNLTQTGGQSYGISQTCVQAGGCGTVTVRQGP